MIATLVHGWGGGIGADGFLRGLPNGKGASESAGCFVTVCFEVSGKTAAAGVAEESTGLPATGEGGVRLLKLGRFEPTAP
jgi:hypothetical protein